jgi:hypothetical protein
VGCTAPGDGVYRLDLIGAHLVEPLVGQRDDFVLAHTGFEHVDDVLVDPVHHRSGLVEQHDLVHRLDHARIQHALLGVDDGQPLTLHLEQERRFDDVHAHRSVGEARIGQDALDLGDRITHQAGIRRDRTAEAEETRPPVLGG